MTAEAWLNLAAMNARPVAEPLPWHAQPGIPDPNDRPAINEDGPCTRCRKGDHRACRDVRWAGVCCCEVQS